VVFNLATSSNINFPAYSEPIPLADAKQVAKALEERMQSLAETTKNVTPLEASASTEGIAGFVRVTKIEEEQAVFAQPHALDTFTAVELCCSNLDMTPDHVMGVLENLYHWLIITYVRTETTAYGDEVIKALHRFCQH
jgi:DNA topoisomerase IA